MFQTEVQWEPKERDYARESVLLPGEDVTDSGSHPLSPSVGGVVQKQLAQADTPVAAATPQQPQRVDPLGAVASNTLMDPLQAAAAAATPAPQAQTQTPQAAQAQSPSAQHEDSFAPWASMKPGILQEFTADQQLDIVVSFMNTPTPGKAKAAADRTAARLEELEQTEENEQKQLLQVTQQEYVKHIDTMHNDIVAAWSKEDRVRTLKIAIQCAKLLLDTKVAKFYPSKFVLVTEILDTFGKLVFDRIKQRRTVINSATGQPFTDKDIPQHVKEFATETCRNWFYKIASIRELLPRLYVEMAIVRCYTFLEDTPQFKMIIHRVCSQIRGCGDPLIQFYAQAYLARKAHEVLPMEKDYLLQAFSDVVQVHQTLGAERLKVIHTRLNLSAPDYMRLYKPALEWVLQCIAFKANQNSLEAALEVYTRQSKNAFFLNTLISAFPPAFVANQALRFTSLIREADNAVFPQHLLFRTLGVNLTLGAPPVGKELEILNDVWNVVMKMENAEHYTLIAEVFIEYTLKHCQFRHMAKLLVDILRHVQKAENLELLFPQIQSIIQKIVANYDDIPSLFGLDAFNKLVDLTTGPAQVNVCKSILEAFYRYKGTLSDMLIISSMFSQATVVHDTVNSLTLADDLRTITKLISAFVVKVDFGRDVEKQLNFYVECRQCFSSLDGVKSTLVQGVCRLAIRTLTLARNNHNKKTAAFIRACMAFCYITIPSMDNVFSRLNVSLLSAEVALLNQSIPQADSFLRAAVTLILEVPTLAGADKETEEQLAGFFANLCGFLVVAPGHPDLGCLHLVQGLATVVQKYPWMTASAAKASVLVSLLSLLGAASQQKFPYHVDKVESNDVLYRQDADYEEGLTKLFGDVTSMLLDHLNTLTKQPDAQQVAARAALEVMNVALSQSRPSAKLVPLLQSLYSYARGVSSVEAFARNTATYVRLSPYADLLKRL
eukprot:TRINITY_DN7716_c0_g1_i1.p1 TRINITY_DN7716_c0_g1~~TRINITY_DN7716_c0_g1_i1.p1  ORF type:complete len:948 (-),score=305.61 TRINITY_DN7716_c0_g1_i1:43-2886(-)